MRKLVMTTILATFALSGCQNMEYDKAAIGSTVGAVLGAGLAYANADKDKMGRAAAIGAALGGGAGLLLDKKEQRLRQALSGTGVSISRNPDGSINLVMPNVTFATGSSNIQPGFQNVLTDVGRVLSEGGTAGQVRLTISGHTDSTGSTSTNNQLSKNRANSVLQYLSGQGLSASRMSASGYGSNQPVADNSSAAGREQNRRVEIKISI